MPKTVEKPKAVSKNKTVAVKATKPVAKNGTSKKTVTVNKTPAVGKTEERPSEKAMRLAKKDVATKKSKKAGKAEYTPAKDSMRHFVYAALKQGVASANKVKQRAAKLAGKAGIKKYAEPDSYKGFDIAFFVKMLEDKGVNVERDGEKYGVSA